MTQTTRHWLFELFSQQSFYWNTLPTLSEYPGDILTGEGVVAGGVDEGGIAVFLDVLFLDKMNARGILISEVS